MSSERSVTVKMRENHRSSNEHTVFGQRASSDSVCPHTSHAGPGGVSGFFATVQAKQMAGVPVVR
jgi:hypothetical protein